MKIRFENEDELKSIVHNTGDGDVNPQQEFLKIVSGYPVKLEDVVIENGIVKAASIYSFKAPSEDIPPINWKPVSLD